VLLLVRYGMSPRVGLAMVVLIPLAMILVTDLEAKRVPNVIMLPSLAVMLVVGSLFGAALPWTADGSWWSSLAGAALGFVIFRLLIWLGVAIFGEGALGEGDMTLASYVGAAVGFPVVLEALLLAFLLGGVGALLVLVVRKGGLKTAIPYGPFIILGCAVTLIWGGELLQWFFS
jgi:leader peptidase (prepilin peptidase)/N-methyltransferase